jgi:20S proteasome subunit beta 5
MNGKRWPWEAVALLPFIDSERLIQASSTVDQSLLTQEERERNSEGIAVVMTHDAGHTESIPGIGTMEGFQTIEACKTVQVPYEQSNWHRPPGAAQALKQGLNPNTKCPLPGFGTLRDAPVQSLWRRKLGINVFGSRSRYRTSCLEISSLMPPLPPIQVLAPKLIGTSVFVNYPYFVEALVTAVSDENVTVRGKNEARKWDKKEADRWRYQRDGDVRRAETGEGYPGTGGVIVPPDQAFTLSVRPLQGLVTTADGKAAKSYARFEIEVPLISILWGPSQLDSRLMGIPSRLEKNAYEVAMAPTNNDIGSDGRSGKIHKKGAPKRRKLFPAKPQSIKGSVLQKQQHLDVSNDLPKVTAAYYSSVQSGCNGLRGGGLNLPSRQQPVPFFPNSSFRPDGKVFSSLSSSAWTQLQRRFSSPSLFPFENPATAATTLHPCSNPFYSRWSSRPVPPLSLNSARAGGRLRRATTVYNPGSGFRSRVVAAGLTLATLLWIPTTKAATTDSVVAIPNPWTQPRSPDEGQIPWRGWVPVDLLLHDQQPRSPHPQVSPVIDLRGGDILEGLGTSLYPSAHPSLSPSSTPPLEFAHGTTTLAFAFKGGIIAAVDSRASLGNFVGSKTTQKVLPISTHILGTMAGGAADCQRWIRHVKKEALLHELTTDGRRMSVGRASRILSNVLYSLRGMGLSVGTMVMGYDDIPDDSQHNLGDDISNGSNIVRDGETCAGGGAGPPAPAQPHIYYVDDTGVRIRGDLFAVGSGSTFALGILDTATAPDRYSHMTVEEAIDLGIRAIRHATFRDAYSGGYINVFLITPQEGWKKVYTEDIARRTPEVWKALQEKPIKTEEGTHDPDNY